MSDEPTACLGPVCVECNLCTTCGRIMNVTPHLEVCACEPDAVHYRCRACAARFVANLLTGEPRGG